MCHQIDRVQLPTIKRDHLHWSKFALFPVDPKSQLAEVREYHVPVLTQLIPRMSQNEPAVEIVEIANAVFSHGIKGYRSNLRKEARREGPCTDMPVPQTQSGKMACAEEESRHESTSQVKSSQVELYCHSTTCVDI